jgi:hypothetical protein
MSQLSPSERRLKSLIPTSKGRRVTTRTLHDQFYGRSRYRPTPQNIHMMLQSLERKLASNGGVTRLVKTGRAGPHPMEVWLQRAKRAQ